jgi:hypothetical protein
VQMKQSGNSVEICLDPWYSYRDATLRAVVTMPALSGVDLSGASSLLVVDAADFPPTAAFSAELSGASSLLLPEVTAGEVSLELSGASTASGGMVASTARIDVSGASHLTASGSAGSLTAEVSGASEGDFRSLPGSDGQLDVSGTSRAWINRSGLVSAEVSGASTLYYRGGLTWGHLEVSGGSQIRPY